MKTLFITYLAGYKIQLEAHRGENKFRVTYGKQVSSNLDYSRAAYELGACIMHAARLQSTEDQGETK